MWSRKARSAGQTGAGLEPPLAQQRVCASRVLGFLVGQGPDGLRAQGREGAGEEIKSASSREWQSQPQRQTEKVCREMRGVEGQVRSGLGLGLEAQREPSGLWADQACLRKAAIPPS